MNKFPHYKQLDQMDCGSTCLRIICKYYGKHYTLNSLREKTYTTREGVSLLGISDAAENLGFRTRGIQIDLKTLKEEANLPIIIHWSLNHFVVLYKIKKKKYYISDPAMGKVTYSETDFKKFWLSSTKAGKENGIALILEPTPKFYEIEEEKPDTKANFFHIYKYIAQYKRYFLQIALAMLFGSLIQLIFPFLTQSLVDVGIENHDLNFVYLILVAQTVLTLSSMSVGFIQSWLMLHISTRVNISLVSDFLIKLMKLPISYFDSKMIGDILQRIGDHGRIQSFLTSSSINIIFSILNFFMYSAVMVYYNVNILIVFLIGSVFYIGWIFLFLKKRKEIDYKNFKLSAENQSNLIQMINGMQEIKLNGCEKQKRWQWEDIQAKLFKVTISSTILSQLMSSGSTFINEIKNIIISIIVAMAVIEGDMTLGMMLSVQYIIGSLNAPIVQLMGFIQEVQDTKISLERIGEIHIKEDEEPLSEMKIRELKSDRNLYLNELSFQYDGPHSEKVLENIELEIPKNKITAIVGASGSGKTTLIKLLLGFYKPVSGDIKIGDIKHDRFSERIWRTKCGVVMQEGYIFSDTIASNIGVSDETVDKEKLLNAVKTANIDSFIETLPLGYNTKIGIDGHGLSQGQKQRILIARAVYKNPEYLFFDEATNSLDANNEKIIMENLNKFFKNRTVIIVAHRLSTVKNADQIVVLDKGKIVERGKHSELTKIKGEYYNLVKNQLELGS